MKNLDQFRQNSFIEIKGIDSVGFLNGLITNDCHILNETTSLYTCLLSPQGKYLHDFILIKTPTGLLIDITTKQKDIFLKRLNLYKLRSKVDIIDTENTWSLAYIDPMQASYLSKLLEFPLNIGIKVGQTLYHHHYGFFVTDPRHIDLGIRWIYPASMFVDKFSPFFLNQDQYEMKRISLAIPSSNSDLIPDKSLPLENNFDELGAINWKKGCYIGQEVTARMKYKNAVKKKLHTVRLETRLTNGTYKILTSANHEAGELLSTHQDLGLALLRLEFLNTKEQFFVESDQGRVLVYPLNFSVPVEKVTNNPNK